MNTVCRRVTVGGLVIGVGFRYSTLQEASRYPGLTGYVRNVDSRTVECVVQGEGAHVDELVEWLHWGPSTAHVVTCQVVEESVKPNLTSFRVTF